MAFDFSNLVPQMLGAAEKEIVSGWDEVKSYAETEFKKFTLSLEDIGKLLLSGKISVERAQLLTELHKNAIQNVLLTIEGLGILAVQRAINAAVSVIKDSVNSAIGFAVI